MTCRAAIYARVSIDEQAQAGAVQAQLEACRAYCQRQGWEIVQEYVDEGVSGALPLEARPEGSRLLFDSQTSLFQVRQSNQAGIESATTGSFPGKDPVPAPSPQ